MRELSPLARARLGVLAAAAVVMFLGVAAYKVAVPLCAFARAAEVWSEEAVMFGLLIAVLMVPLWFGWVLASAAMSRLVGGAIAYLSVIAGVELPIATWAMVRASLVGAAGGGLVAWYLPLWSLLESAPPMPPAVVVAMAVVALAVRLGRDSATLRRWVRAAADSEAGGADPAQTA